MQTTEQESTDQPSPVKIRVVYSRDTKIKALGLFESGLGYRACATQLGVTPYTVRDWKRAYALGRFPDKKTRSRVKIHRYAEAVRERACHMRLDLNMSYHAVSLAVGVPIMTVRRWARYQEKKQAVAPITPVSE